MRKARRVGVRDVLPTTPLPTESTATGKTIGIITVARFAAQIHCPQRP